MKYKLVKVDELNELLAKAREIKRNERDEAYESGYDDATAEWSSYSVTPITRADTRAFRDAIQRLDYENAPRHKRRASVSPQFARELMSHPDFPMFAAFREDRYRGYNYGRYVGEMFGVPIFAVEGVYPEIIAE